VAGTRRLAAAFAAAAVATSLPQGPALALRMLHVDALSMRADRTFVATGEVFHLTIHVRVRERVTELDELVVPDVGTMQLLGDERHAASTPAGTDVTETLTLEPRQAGTFTLNGAYLDATDARTGKPTRFSANPVRIVVAQSVQAAPSVDWSVDLMRVVGWLAFAAVVLVAFIAAIVALAVRAQRRPAPSPVHVAAPPPPKRTPRDAVADALRVYRTAPSHGALMRLRAALFAVAGVDTGATLRDALASTADHGLRAALGAAERTAFGPAHARDAASAELIDATEAWLR